MVSRLLAFALSSCVCGSIAMVVSYLYLQSMIPPTGQVVDVPHFDVSVTKTMAVDDESKATVTQASLGSRADLAPADRPIPVSERQFTSLMSRGTVLVKFGADWCGPCRRVEPELREVAASNQGHVTVLTVDVDKEKQLADKFNVGSIPRLILFQDGKEVQSWTGFRPADQLQSSIDRAKADAPRGDVTPNPFTT